MVNTVFQDPVHQVLKKTSRTSHIQMAKQDGRRPFEAQLEPPLPISPGTGAYHRGLQNPMESSGVASWREKVAAVFVSA